MNDKLITTGLQELSPLQLLEKVDAFYKSAWGMLILYVTILIAFVGIVIPFLVQWFQRRFFILREDRIRTELKKYCDDLKTQINKEIDGRLDKEFSEIKTNIEKEAEGANAGVYHVRGNYFLSQRNYPAALESFLDAISCYIVVEDQLNIQRVLELVSDCLQRNIYSEDIENLQHDGYNIENAIKLLEKNDKGGRYSNFIIKIKKSLSIARQKKKTVVP